MANNFALVAGGGLENQGNLTAVNSTVSNNAAKSGGGIFRQGTRATVTLADTIVAGNRVTSPRGAGPDMFGKAKSLGFNLIGQTSGSSGWAHNDLLRVNPLLAPLAYNGGPTPTMALQPLSPASGAGRAQIASVGVPEIDQRGALRTGGSLGALDIGAYQSSSSYLVTSTADSDDVGTLRAAVMWANTNNPTASPAAIPTPNTIFFDTNGVFSKPQTILLAPPWARLSSQTPQQPRPSSPPALRS